MEDERKIIFTFSESDIKKIIKESVAREYPYLLEATVNVGTKRITKGYGISEHDVYIVDVTATIRGRK